MDLPGLAALAVVAGAVAAAASRDGRTVILGLSLAAVAAALVASPGPGFLAVAARALGVLAAGYLLWMAVATGRAIGAGSPIGLAAEAALGGAAFVIGLAIRPVDPLAGPAAAQAAGLAAVTLAVMPLAGRNVFRLGIGTMLLTIGCSLLLGAWSGATPLQHLALAALLIGIAGATCLLAPDVPAEAVVVAPALSAAPVPAVRQPLGQRQQAGSARPVLPVRPAPSARSASSRAAALSPQPAQGPASAQPPRTAVEDEPAWPEMPPARPEPAPRSFTADPAADEWDAWASWHAPEPEPGRKPRSTRRDRPDSGKAGGR